MFDQSYVIETLKNSICVAKFTKADGSERTMRCTLIPSYLPEDFRNRGMLLNEVDKNSVPVWDLDLNAWRSFRVDTLKEFAPAHLQAAKQLLWG